MSNPNASGASPPSAPSRRQRTGKPGIYYRLNAKGQRSYEFTYTDSHGKQRWRTVPGKLQDAIDARDETRRRLRRGERVIPTKATLADYARAWLESQRDLRPSTRSRYGWAIESKIAPYFGKLKPAEISEDHVAGLIGEMQTAGYKPSTIKAVLGPLSLILGRASRRGQVPANVVSQLERSERPRGKRREMRTLDRAEMVALLDNTPTPHRPLIATLIFTGLRVSEAIGLTWASVDFEHGLLHVREQVDHKTRERVDLKTSNAIRSVVLMPALARMLGQHRMSSSHSRDAEPVFATATGGPLNRDNIRNRILRPATNAAGLDVEGKPKLRTHDLRHTFASLLIASGASVVFVSKQMGHASPTTTLGVYSHLFDAREHADRMAAILEEGFGGTLSAVYQDMPASAVPSSAPVGSSLRALDQ